MGDFAELGLEGLDRLIDKYYDNAYDRVSDLRKRQWRAYYREQDKQKHMAKAQGLNPKQVQNRLDKLERPPGPELPKMKESQNKQQPKGASASQPRDGDDGLGGYNPRAYARPRGGGDGLGGYNPGNYVRPRAQSVGMQYNGGPAEGRQPIYQNGQIAENVNYGSIEPPPQSSESHYPEELGPRHRDRSTYSRSSRTLSLGYSEDEASDKGRSRKSERRSSTKAKLLGAVAGGLAGKEFGAGDMVSVAAGAFLGALGGKAVDRRIDNRREKNTSDRRRRSS